MKSLSASARRGALLLTGMIGISFASDAATLPTRFTQQPSNTNAFGNSAANEQGQFRRDTPVKRLQYFLGTEASAGPGALFLYFDRPFRDGPGADFAIVTGQDWGALATTALVQFFLGDRFQGSIVVPLAPDQVFRIELPGTAGIADRVVITNLSPDPPGVNDDATMSFVDAGVSHTIAVDPTAD